MKLLFFLYVFLFIHFSFSQVTQTEFSKLDSNEFVYEFDIKYVGKSVYPDASYQYVIDYLVELMKKNPTWTLKIRGHVCCGPSYRTSLKRAKNVYKILYKMGIPKEHMCFEGVNDKYPIVFPEQTDEDAAKNRRVDFIIKK